MCYSWGMDYKKQTKKPSRRPRPSYEEGELRDKSIEKKMDPTFRREELLRTIWKAAKRQ